MTKQREPSRLSERDRPVEIEVTPDMIQAARLSDQFVHLLMIWEDSVYPATRVAEILTEVFYSSQAKSDFISLDGTGLKRLIESDNNSGRHL